jgi:hypothetical protein
MIFGSGGSLVPTIFIVADEDMPEDDIDFHKVNGLCGDLVTKLRVN